MYNGEKLIDRPLRWGMVGGGRTGQVGYKHRTGALRDNTTYRLVCGAFDVDAARGRDFGLNLGVDGDRLYPDYKTLIAEEAKRDDGVEVVTVATPNFSHYEITKALLEAGIHVICEKPLFFTVAECDAIRALAERKGLIVGVTYGFTGHPLVHQMAAMVRKGMLGEIRMVDLQYTHGFNAGDDVGAPDAVKWRTNPKTSGPTFVLGDIGTHIYYLSEIVRGYGCINRLQQECGGAEFNNMYKDSNVEVQPEIDFVSHAAAMGAHAEKAGDIADLEARIVAARGRSSPRSSSSTPRPLQAPAPAATGGMSRSRRSAAPSGSRRPASATTPTPGSSASSTDIEAPGTPRPAPTPIEERPCRRCSASRSAPMARCTRSPPPPPAGATSASRSTGSGRRERQPRPPATGR